MSQSAPLRIIVTVSIVAVLLAVAGFAYSRWMISNQNILDQSSTSTSNNSANMDETPATTKSSIDYDPTLPVVGTLVLADSTSAGYTYSVSVQSSETPASVTVQIEASTNLYSEPETDGVFKNLSTGWTEQFNKQTTEMGSSYLRYGALVMPPTVATPLSEKTPAFTITTENPISPEYARGTIEIVNESNEATLGRIIINTQDTSSPTNTNDD